MYGVKDSSCFPCSILFLNTSSTFSRNRIKGLLMPQVYVVNRYDTGTWSSHTVNFITCVKLTTPCRHLATYEVL